jgi:small subunit ribosomal protein S1
MAKAPQKGPEQRPRRATGSSSAVPTNKAKGPKSSDDDEDPIEAAKRRKREEEEISGEAIPVTELRKSLYAKQVAGEFDWDAFESKGFGEGYSKDKKAEMNQMYSGTVTTVNSGEVVSGPRCYSEHWI